MTSNPAAPAGTSNWCDDMITWMRQQIGGDWEGWTAFFLECVRVG